MPDRSALSKTDQPMGLRERKKLATRNKLIEVADRLFNRYEFEDVKVEDIAAEADVSIKTFFNYFPGKGKLLEAVLIDWLAEVNLWSSEEAPPTDMASAIRPSNIKQIQDWVIRHRRILKMIQDHTNLFDSIYYSDASVDDENNLFPPDYRRPRIERVREAQRRGLIRDDISARLVSDLYDFMRIDLVRRWLRTPDDIATPQSYRQSYDEAMEVLFMGLAPRD